MKALRIVCSLALALLAATSAAQACTDGGPPNRSCNDGGAQWIGCTDHAQCPEGQYCSAQGACGCGSRDVGVCDDGGCHDCAPWSGPDSGPDSGLSCRGLVTRFVCPDPTVTDAGGGGGGGGGGSGNGCAVQSPGERAARSPVAVLAALVGIAALARVRRRGDARPR